MSFKNTIKETIISGDKFDFENAALEIFNFQYTNNVVYRQYVDAIKVVPDKIDSIDKIPFLPIRFFKTHRVSTTSFAPQHIFESSGTTASTNSKHYVKDTELYEVSFKSAFRKFYGDVSDSCIIGLLPSYLERKNSSLVYMVDTLIKDSGHERSGFYLNDFDNLFRVLSELEKRQQKTLLIGVTFALLDFAEQYHFPLKHTIVMETGGMKGKREELLREQVHALLCRAFQINKIHSEYGMTELLSQAYSKGDGIFNTPPWMRVLCRHEDDPLSLQTSKENSAKGLLNIIDLANIYSCSFIATDDLGTVFADGNFEITGRMDNSDVRGCSLLVL
jgi:hypothetical protein